MNHNHDKDTQAKKVGDITKKACMAHKTMLACVIQPELVEDNMDLLKDQIEALNERKMELIEQIRRIDAAVAVLSGDTKQKPSQKPHRNNNEKFHCMSETINLFNQQDYLSINEIQNFMVQKGIGKASTSGGRNAIATTVGRLVTRGALIKTADKRFYKTDQWQEKTQGERKPRTIRRKSSSISDISYNALQEHGKPIHYTELMKLIQESVTIGGKDPRSNMTAHLSNDKRFKSLGNGVWTLNEWTGTILNNNNEEVVRVVPADHDNRKQEIVLRKLHGTGEGP